VHVGKPTEIGAALRGESPEGCARLAAGLLLDPIALAPLRDASVGSGMADSASRAVLEIKTIAWAGHGPIIKDLRNVSR